MKSEKIGILILTENVSTSASVSYSALSDLKSFFRSGTGKSDSADSSAEKNKTTDNQKNSDVTRKALTELLTKYNSYSSESSEKKSDEETQKNEAKTNSLAIETPSSSEQTALTIKVPETKTSTEPVSFNLPKNKNTILSELRLNAFSSRMSVREIAQKYGISYIQAQEIFIELNQDKNGIVREFNLPKNSTVSYLV